MAARHSVHHAVVTLHVVTAAVVLTSYTVTSINIGYEGLLGDRFLCAQQLDYIQFDAPNGTVCLVCQVCLAWHACIQLVLHVFNVISIC